MKRKKTVLTLATLVAGMFVFAGSVGPSLAAPNPSVTGGGQYTDPDFSPATVAMSAVTANGRVLGQFQQHNPLIGLSVHGTITCLLPVPGDPTAMIVVGILTQIQKSTNPDFAVIQQGQPFLLLVKDNGEGAGAPADVVTAFVALIDATAADIDCTDPRFLRFVYNVVLPGWLLPYQNPLTNGNFQVRP